MSRGSAQGPRNPWIDLCQLLLISLTARRQYDGDGLTFQDGDHNVRIFAQASRQRQACSPAADDSVLFSTALRWTLRIAVLTHNPIVQIVP